MMPNSAWVGVEAGQMKALHQSATLALDAVTR